MVRKKSNKLSELLERFALKATKATGTSAAFILALSVILVWIVTGPLFHFSDTWQLVINTGTTIITFLMVFLIQRTQNKDALAIHIKLNEIVAALEGASNRLIDCRRSHRGRDRNASQALSGAGGHGQERLEAYPKPLNRRG